MRQRWIWVVAGGVVTLLAAGVIAAIAMPRRGALLIRYVFERDAAEVRKHLDRYAPQGVVSITNQPYRRGDEDALLDAYFPESADHPGVRLPAVIWTHGGAWISGNKDDAAPYFQLIAAEGYVVISLGYSLGPGRQYPTPIHQVNDALAYIQRNADRFHLDVDRMVMAGDSAGSQITSQVAALITNPCYAEELNIEPSLRPEQLRGVILFCGIYDMKTYMERSNIVPVRLLRWGTKTAIWAYLGYKCANAAALDQMSSINHVTVNFPPTFISGGNDDSLTDWQSRPMAVKLDSLDVEVTSLFFPQDHEPGLGHEFQFKLDLADAQDALERILEFLRHYTSPSPSGPSQSDG